MPRPDGAEGAEGAGGGGEGAGQQGPAAEERPREVARAQVGRTAVKNTCLVVRVETGFYSLAPPGISVPSKILTLLYCMRF